MFGDKRLADYMACFNVKPQPSRTVEVSWLLAVIAAVMSFGSFVLKRNEPGKGGHVAVH
jgi:hypothetical protein